MVKHILLIRHGQGDHNKLFAENRVAEALALKDPPINDVGKNQAKDLRVKLKNVLKTDFPLEVIISSPMRRALMTADIVFAGSDYPVVISPLPTEMGDGGCDYGSPQSQLLQEFPHHDFSGLEESWWPIDEDFKMMGERARKFKEYLNSRPESHIAVVSHGQFLTKFMEQADCCTFWNCECRQIRLEADGTVSEPAVLKIRVKKRKQYS